MISKLWSLINTCFQDRKYTRSICWQNFVFFRKPVKLLLKWEQAVFSVTAVWKVWKIYALHSSRELIKVVGCNVTEVGAGFPMLLTLSACVNLLPVVLNHPSQQLRSVILLFPTTTTRSQWPSINAAFTLFFLRRMTWINSVRTIKGTRKRPTQNRYKCYFNKI